MTKARDIASAAPAPAGVTSTELGYVDGVTSALQTQIDGKVGSTIVDAKADLITATAADTPARLAVGSNGTVLTADSAESTGLKWVAPSSGSMTLLGTVDATGLSSVVFTSINQGYKDLVLVIRNSMTVDGNPSGKVLPNGSSTISSGIITQSAGAGPSGTQNFNNEAIPLNKGGAGGDINGGLRTSIVTFFDYANTTTYKVSQVFGTQEVFNNWGGFSCITTTKTTDAITSLTILGNTVSSNFTAGTILLYGVK
jgi:hypothetical protein